MPTVETELPGKDRDGQHGVWELTDQHGAAHRIDGQFLGMGSSHRPDHKGHASGVSAPRGVHCSTCRWTEVRLFQDQDGTYLVVNCGASDVPGERDLIKVTRVRTPFEVVESLTALDRGSRRPSLTFPSRRALAQAASHSAGLRDAYVNSPVT